MAVNKEIYSAINKELAEINVTLVAVSKTKPIEDILEMYAHGQRDFGENYVQELVDKEAVLPKDIRWHFIGHLQSNKVKYIAPFVHLIHGVDSLKLLQEIDKQGAKAGRTINVLLQIHIAQEETKFGLDETELQQIIESIKTAPLANVNVVGLMGMASFSDDKTQISNEFKILKFLFEKYSQQKNDGFKMEVLSMGMSGDYQIAIEEGSNMVRIGSLLFGERNYTNK